MLKKIVKYGNSCALVLDKALLELLDMREGSVVKIKTDGVSLFLTPQNMSVQESVFPTLTMEETFDHAIRLALEQSFGNSEKASAYQSAYREISGRYAALVKNGMEKPEMRDAIAAIQKCFANDKANPEYTKQIRQTYHQYIPELKDLHQEMEALAKKYSPQSGDESNTSFLIEEFRKVHEKYGHVMEAVALLNEDPEYIHEMMLLSEKYQGSKEASRSKEYFEAYAQIISKRIPEYEAYQQELKKVGEAMPPKKQ